MAIHPTCDICSKPLTDYGAILLSPPSKDSQVIKYHICVVCYKKLILEHNITIKNTYTE